MQPFPIITAHGISDASRNSPTHVSINQMRKWLDDCKLKQIHFQVLDFPFNFKDRISACLTFDDALLSILKIAEHLPSPGTIFVVTDYVGRINRWRGQPDWVPVESCLTWSQIRELTAQGWCIGAHSCSHPDLNRCDLSQIRNEIECSKKTIEDRIGQECKHFAYPYGIAPELAQEIVQQLDMIGYGTDPGWVDSRQDSKCLPRLDIYDLIRPGMASSWTWSQPGCYETQLMKYKRMVGAGIRQIRQLAS